MVNDDFLHMKITMDPPLRCSIPYLEEGVEYTQVGKLGGRFFGTWICLDPNEGGYCGVSLGMFEAFGSLKV